MLDILGAVVGVCLIAYLLISVIRPEKF